MCSKGGKDPDACVGCLTKTRAAIILSNTRMEGAFSHAHSATLQWLHSEYSVKHVLRPTIYHFITTTKVQRWLGDTGEGGIRCLKVRIIHMQVKGNRQ
jgi:hypothetical protein